MEKLCWLVGVDNLDVLFLVKDYLLVARVAHHDYLLLVNYLTIENRFRLRKARFELATFKRLNDALPLSYFRVVQIDSAFQSVTANTLWPAILTS